VQNACILGAPCTGEKFPVNDMLAIMTTGNMSIGQSGKNPPRVMALLYTQGDFTSPGDSGTRIVGAVAANRFCFARGCGGSGEARLFEVTLNRFPIELFPGRGRHWEVSYVPKTWKECKNVPANANLTCS
jgi:hypothetical protein